MLDTTLHDVREILKYGYVSSKTVNRVRIKQILNYLFINTLKDSGYN